MIKLLLAFLLLFSLPIQAESLSVEEFSRLIRHLQIQVPNSKNNALTMPAESTDLCHRIAEVSEITYGVNRFYVDLLWINEVMKTINGDISDSKRRLLFANMADTLQALAEELSAPQPPDAFTRQQMLDALERVLGKTSVVTASPGATQNSGTSWYTGGAYVIDEPGEAISVIQSTPTGSSYGNASGNQSSSQSSQGQYSRNPTNSQGFQSQNNQQVVQNNQQVAQNNSFATPQAKPAARPNIRQRQAPTPPAPKPQPVPKVKPPPITPPKKSTDSFVFWAILIISSILFTVMIFIAIRRLHKKIAAEKSELHLTEKDLPPEKLQIQTIYAKALQAAAEENYGEAVRLLTIGALLMLEEHQILNFKETMTNGEYLHELLHSRQLHSLFSPPLALFDKLIYGFQNPDKDDFEVFRKFYLNLEQSCK